MRYVAAYVLAVLGGNENPTAKDMKTILGSVGVDFEQSRADTVLKAMQGKSVDELIELGRSKLACVPTGGGGGAAAGGAAPAAESGAAAAKEDKKEAKKEESEEEGDDDMGFGLFD